jgi:hypothetical protein
VDAYIGRRELGALSRRALGMDCTLGLDLGGRSAVGIRTLSLWTLGFVWRTLGLDTGTVWSNAPLCSGTGGLGRRRKRRVGLQHEFFDRHRRRCGLVPARAA